MTEGAVLAVEHLEVRYGRRVALADVSLAVAPGSVYALLGRNGAGKSSLVRCALGEQRPASGAVRLFGEDAWSGRAAAMRRVGVAPETPDAPPRMTAAQLERFCSRLYPTWDRGAVVSRLERFGVPLATPFARLSKGGKAQLALALALGHRPALLVLDDPTLGLDAVARRELFDELIGELADRGTTVFVTSHDLAGIEGIADRVGVLDHGRLVVDEPMEALKGRFRRLRMAPAQAAAVPYRVEGTHDAAWAVEVVVSDWDGSRAGMEGVTAEAMDLEGIFLALVGGERGGGR